MLAIANDLIHAALTAAADAGDASDEGLSHWEEWKELNYLTIPVSAVICFMLGWLWYTVLFGKVWLRLMAIKPEGKAMPVKPMIISFIALLLMATGMLMVHKHIGFLGAFDGLIFAGVIWLAFVATTSATNYAYNGKPFLLWLIDSTYHLACLLIMGLAVAVWQHPGTVKFLP